jgi:hypothetical protein
MILYFLIVSCVVSLTISFSYNRSSHLYARSVASMLPKSYDIVATTVSIKQFLLEQEYKMIGPLNMLGLVTGLASTVWLFRIEWYYSIIFIIVVSVWLVVTPIFKQLWTPKLRNLNLERISFFGLTDLGLIYRKGT